LPFNGLRPFDPARTRADLVAGITLAVLAIRRSWAYRLLTASGNIDTVENLSRLSSSGHACASLRIV
jgi:hypothetical protein